jgi:hypothetical protein
MTLTYDTQNYSECDAVFSFKTAGYVFTPQVDPPTASVVSWSEFLAANPEVPGSIPDATRFWVAVGLERGPLRLVKINEELPNRKSSGSGLEN